MAEVSSCQLELVPSEIDAADGGKWETQLGAACASFLANLNNDIVVISVGVNAEVYRMIDAGAISELSISEPILTPPSGAMFETAGNITIDGLDDFYENIFGSIYRSQVSIDRNFPLRDKLLFDETSRITGYVSLKSLAAGPVASWPDKGIYFRLTEMKYQY